MKIAVAQLKPIKGDIERNIEKHKKLIELAASRGTGTLIFPELSITGYEPELANELATNQDDRRFDDFQSISDTKNITIGVGMPTRSDSGVRISLLIFQPNRPRQIYSKQHLHADENPYFTAGNHSVFLEEGTCKIALAICYELSVPEHPTNGFLQGANIYIASVAKTLNGVEKAAQTLSDIAKTYSMTVLMANCVGHCDNFESAGNSSIWNNKGVLLGQLDDTQEGILVIDTDTQEVIEETL
ncbi:carbon-nitrogen hydrolase family protein [Spirosoma validum]|uniref:Carbon-nitrogen hydrolase family protein n=1 Tax=Spirosoma validum TaxID=2771355 RepID=A0A927B4H0_9BACT|nr:carbon-nitrogen hydrolase family protein [Spirosoma validum]MBD2755133.1 carbon-nitrogen hydrolase family protein [Spirosoma validum]